MCTVCSVQCVLYTFCFPEWHSFQSSHLLCTRACFFSSPLSLSHSLSLLYITWCPVLLLQCSMLFIWYFSLSFFHSFCVCVTNCVLPYRQQFNIFTNNKHKEPFAIPEQFLAINITKDGIHSNSHPQERYACPCQTLFTIVRRTHFISIAFSLFR